MFNRQLVAVCLSCCLVTPAAAAGFSQEAWDARSTSLGNAYVGALQENGISPFWNPAALAAVQNGEVSFTYGTPSHRTGQPNNKLGSLLYSDLNRGSAIKLGFWANRFETEDVLRETTYAMTVSHRLYQSEQGHRLFAGASVKYLDNRDLTPTSGAHGTMAGDAGFLFSFPSRATIGLSVRDLNSPRIGINRDEQVPVRTALGAALPLAQNTLFLFDVLGTASHKERDTVETRAGLEQRFFKDRIALRFGANSKSINTGFGMRFNVGKHADLDASYAYVDPYSDGRRSRIHMGTLKLAFGMPADPADDDSSYEDESEQYKRALNAGAPDVTQGQQPRTRRDFIVGPDDVIQIEVKNHPELDVITVVNPWGFIEVPFVGPLSVNEQNEKEIEQALSKIYSDFFTTPPTVDVTVKEYNSRFVYVLGAVAKPGKYPLKSNPVTLRDVIVAAGLPTERAALWRAFVVRKTKNGTVTKHINLGRILYRNEVEHNIELDSQDIVYLPMTILDTIAVFIGRIVSPVISIPGYFITGGRNTSSSSSD